METLGKLRLVIAVVFFCLCLVFSLAGNVGTSDAASNCWRCITKTCWQTPWGFTGCYDDPYEGCVTYGDICIE